MIARFGRRPLGKYLPAILSAADILIVNLLFFILLAIYPQIRDGHQIKLTWLLVNVAYLPILIWFRDPLHHQRVLLMDRVVYNAMRMVIVHALFFVTLLEFMGVETMPVRAILVFYAMMIVAMPFWWLLSRFIIKRLRKKGYNYLRVVIIGSGSNALKLYDELLTDAGFGYRVMGFFTDEPFADTPHAKQPVVLGGIDDLRAYASAHHIDQIFFALSGQNTQALKTAVRIADDNVIQFFYVPQISHLYSRSFELHNIGVMPVLSIRHNPLNSAISRCIKRSFDIAFSSVVLLLSPLWMLPAAIAIKLSSPGPVFFRQERTGYRGVTFKCFKFRTMKVNSVADSLQATKDDPRTTAVGRMMRRTSIDELPQFINVFLGDMSVVGPRPHMVKHTEDYAPLVDRYMVRHFVKPGITGWAQVNGFRGITDELWKMERRVECDVWYIENWSFLLDLKIIVRTVINAFSGEKNAF